MVSDVRGVHVGMHEVERANDVSSINSRVVLVSGHFSLINLVCVTWNAAAHQGVETKSLVAHFTTKRFNTH